MIKKETLYIIITLIASVGIGFIAGKEIGSDDADKIMQIQKLQVTVDRAKSTFPPIPEDVRSISGIVREVHTDSIVIEADYMNPFDESPRMRTVMIGGETKIVRSEQKDNMTIEREKKEFQKLVQSQKSGGVRDIVSLMLLREVSATISDIRPGQQVNIDADENIRYSLSFPATKITIAHTNTPVTTP